MKHNKISMHNCRIGEEIDTAVKRLNEGKLIAFPTETYYGIGVDPFDDDAVNKLFSVKKRDLHKPIPLIIDHATRLKEIVDSIPDPYHVLMAEFWPGPLTLIFDAKSTLSSTLTGQSGSIGVRISPHPLTHALCQKFGKPLPATSANISGQAPAENAQQVKKYFNKEVSYILDGGSSPAGASSTIVDCRFSTCTIIREGKISRSDVERVLEGD